MSADLLPHRFPPHWRPVAPKAVHFVDQFVSNGGRGRDAAVASGYSPASAAVSAAKLLADERILALLAARIVEDPEACAEAHRRLMMPSRPRELRIRLSAMVAGQAQARLVGSAEKPRVQMDPHAAAMRDHMVKFADDLRVPVPSFGAKPPVLNQKPKQPQ